MMHLLRVTLGIGLAIVPSLAIARETPRQEAIRILGRLPAAPAITAEAKLGRALFWDTGLSADGKTACASCHSASTWGGDSVQFSTDALGKPTSRHSLSIFNAMLQPTLRWLGDRKDGADQAQGSLTGTMGFSTKAEAVARLRQNGYEPAFRAVYPGDPEPVSAENFGKALASYQATLITPAPFDRYLDGDIAALTSLQRAGMKAFMDTGCANCHNGPLLGGTAFMKFGVVKDYWTATGATKHDSGRMSITHKPEDQYVFRVPMLRNVAKIGPYFHDGSVDRLEDAVRVMAEVQLGIVLDPTTQASIVAFLESLTGQVPANYAPPDRKIATLHQ